MDEGHNPRGDPPSSEDESGLDGLDEPPEVDEHEPADRPEAAATEIPDLTSDELEVGWGERPRESGWSTDSDEWLLRERPPHWE